MSREVQKLRHPAAAAGRARAGRASAVEAAEAVLKIEHYLDVAKGEITRLDYIVTQFLQAIRPSAPKLADASLNEVVRGTLELLRPELDNRRLNVQEKLARRLATARMDAGQIKQALVNLIKNAMQAMPPGGTLTIETGQNTEEVWVSVADTGGGIAPDQVNQIFEPFYTTKQKGTGLGLMIVQRIVRQHGGHIELESRVGQGATFRIWLPHREKQQKLLR
jgi:signal transduction histidine kinase